MTEVRLLSGDDVVARSDGSQTPVVDYDIADSGPTTLTLEADIEVELRGEISIGEGSTSLFLQKSLLRAHSTPQHFCGERNDFPGMCFCLFLSGNLRCFRRNLTYVGDIPSRGCLHHNQIDSGVR